LSKDDVTIIDQTRIKVGTTEVQIPRTITKTGQVQIPKTIQVPKSISIPSLVQVSKIAQIPKVAQITKLAQVPKLAQIPKLIPTQTVITKLPTTKIPKPIIPFFIPGEAFPKRKRITKEPRPRKQVFTAEIRRRGKWISVGTFKKPKRAAAVGKKRALETAAASVRVRANGKIIPLKPSRLFRQAKTEPGIIVQKKRKRILTRGEKREISLIGARAAKAKRIKSKRIKKKTKKTKKPKKKTKKTGGRKNKIPFS